MTEIADQPHRIIPGSMEYANALVQVGERVIADPTEYQFKRSATDPESGKALEVEGLLWRDIWDYVEAQRGSGDFGVGTPLISPGVGVPR